MKLDLSKMLKVHSSKTHTIMEHPDGHTVHIAHSSLKPVDRAKLHALPMKKMAEGGEVPSSQSTYEAAKKKRESESRPDPGPGDQDTRKKIQDSFNSGLGFADGGDVLPPEEVPQAVGTPAPIPSFLPEQTGIAPMAQASPLAPASADPLAQAVQQNQQNVEGALQGVQQGIQKQADVAGDVGLAQSQALQGAQHQLQQQQQRYQEEHKALQDENSALAADIKDHPIVAKKMFAGMGVGERLTTSLGMLIAGLGGNSPENNPVIKMMNQEIDRDLESQKAQLGAKENLLSANLKKFGDLNQAMAMSKANILEMLSVKTQDIAARSQDPAQKASAMEKLNMIALEKAELLNQVAQQRALLGQPGQGGDEARRLGLVPKEERAEANKEFKEAEAVGKLKEEALANFDKVASMSLAGAFSPNQRAALLGPLVAKLSKATAGRFTETDAKFLESTFPSATDLGADTRQIKRDGLARLIDQAVSTPTLDRYGIKPGGAQASSDNFGFKAK